jgi:hypothetical protein
MTIEKREKNTTRKWESRTLVQTAAVMAFDLLEVRGEGRRITAFGRADMATTPKPPGPRRPPSLWPSSLRG